MHFPCSQPPDEMSHRIRSECGNVEICSNFRQQIRADLRKKKAAEEKEMEKIYAAQEKAAREAENAQRAAAAEARKSRESEAALSQKLEAAPRRSVSKRAAALTGKEAGNPNSRPSRPPNEEAVFTWWKGEEGPRGVGLSPGGKLQQWFHGAISRDVSEGLLRGKQRGAFLIRLSTRIWGYTLTFVDIDRIKHFLIDAADGKYSVFGAQAREHTDLNTLVQFHFSIPVSKSGTMLTEPVGDPAGNLDSLRKLLN